MEPQWDGFHCLLFFFFSCFFFFFFLFLSLFLLFFFFFLSSSSSSSSSLLTSVVKFRKIGRGHILYQGWYPFAALASLTLREVSLNCLAASGGKVILSRQIVRNFAPWDMPTWWFDSDFWIFILGCQICIFDWCGRRVAETQYHKLPQWASPLNF